MTNSSDLSSDMTSSNSDLSQTSGEVSDSTKSSSSSYDSATSAKTVKLAPDDNSITQHAIDKVRNIKLNIVENPSTEDLNELAEIKARVIKEQRTKKLVDQRLANLPSEKRNNF